MHPYWPRLGRCIDYIWLSPDIENALRPILFIDAHGANGNGICIDPAKEIIGWDKLVELLRPINVATENNLCVVSEFCEFSGRMAAHLPRPEERSEAECLDQRGVTPAPWWQQARCLCTS